jgi:hypothetical protein
VSVHRCECAIKNQLTKETRSNKNRVIQEEGGKRAFGNKKKMKSQILTKWEQKLIRKGFIFLFHPHVKLIFLFDYLKLYKTTRCKSSRQRDKGTWKF